MNEVVNQAGESLLSIRKGKELECSKLMRGLRSSHCTQLDQTMCVFSRDRLLMEYTVYTHSISEPKYSYQCSHGTLKGIF